MDTRQTIDSVLDEAYAARRRQKVDDVVRLFNEGVHFRLNGAAPAATDGTQLRSTIQGMFDSMDLLDFHVHCRVIDPPRAVVHWRGKFRSTKSGEIAETDVLDLFEIENGRISSLISFFDTALAMRLMT